MPPSAQFRRDVLSLRRGLAALHRRIDAAEARADRATRRPPLIAQSTRNFFRLTAAAAAIASQPATVHPSHP